jgi:hypothetical protein
MMDPLNILADLYQTTPDRILTVRNGHPETDARQVLFWYLHCWQGIQIKELARRFPWTETTIGYGVRRVNKSLPHNPELRGVCLALLEIRMVAS